MKPAEEYWAELKFSSFPADADVGYDGEKIWIDILTLPEIATVRYGFVFTKREDKILLLHILQDLEDKISDIINNLRENLEKEDEE